jgi:hypothetical protein
LVLSFADNATTMDLAFIAGRNLRFEDYVDMRALRELEKKRFLK